MMLASPRRDPSPQCRAGSFKREGGGGGVCAVCACLRFVYHAELSY